MPLAGHDPRARAHAHYRWAQRYASEGRIAQAIPHFGRALCYGERTTGFGEGGETEDDPMVPDTEKVTDLVSFAGLFYVGLPEEDARALASKLVAKWPNQPVDYGQYTRQMPKLQGSFDATMHETHPGLVRSSGIECYMPRCKTTPIEKVDTPDGVHVFCKGHAAVVRDNLEREARQNRRK
jgi:hypothetical protein